MKRNAIAYNVLSFLFIAILTAACSSSDPFAGADADPNAPDADPNAPDADLSVPDARIPRPDSGPVACVTPPTRMVVLGDSIMACVGGGGKNASTCGVKILNGYLDQNYATGITYENISVSGAVTADIPSQQNNIANAAGHLLVVIFIGGNDLQDYLFLFDDQAAIDKFATDMPRMRNIWENEIFPYFEDAARFPDGVTVIMNTQYNPYDDCNENFFMTDVLIGLLNEFNAQLTEMADARPNVFITDQHGPFLGHGQSRDKPQCPYYISNAEFWMSDLIHPNIPGYANLAAEWAKTSDRMYRDCI